MLSCVSMMALTVYYTGQLLHTLSTYRTRFTTLTVWSICGTIPRALCEAIGISDEDVSTKRSHLTSDSSEGEDPMQLRWLSIQLKPISDADPDALAMYVVALLKHHDKKGEVLKNHCYEQLLDFLQESTLQFLESLFDVLKDGSYKIDNATAGDDDDHTETPEGDDDFEDDDNSRRRDRRRNSEDDHHYNRKRSKKDVEAPIDNQPVKVFDTVLDTITSNVVTEKKSDIQPVARDNSYREKRELLSRSQDQKPAQIKQSQTIKQKNAFHHQHQQQSQHQPPKQLQVAQALTIRATNDTGLMSSFEAMGPETQRAIFTAIGGQNSKLMAPQHQPHPSSLGSMRVRDQISTLDYGRNILKQSDDKYGTTGMVFIPGQNQVYGGMNIANTAPFTGSFLPPPHRAALASGLLEIEKGIPYSTVRPLPPSTDYPGRIMKPAPPSNPPPQQLQPPAPVENQAWRQSRGQQYGTLTPRDGQGHDQTSYQQNGLADHEKCTLKCTGIPPHVTEVDIRGHFKTFGRVVELQLIDSAARDTDGDKKMYKECLVQMGSAQEAKKCFNSPSAVLNNRFIRVAYPPFNIIPLADVLPPTPEELLTASTTDLSPSNAYLNSKSTKKWVHENAGPVALQRQDKEEHFDFVSHGTDRRAKGVGLQGKGFAFGVSNKFVANHNPRVASNFEAASSSSSSSAPHDQAAPASDGLDEDSLYNGIESLVDSSTPIVPASGEHISVPLSKEDIALQQQYEGLRALRQQADSIWKRKEALLQGQIDQYRTMLAKLEASPDCSSRMTLQESIEGKIVDLQSQLRSVRDQRETGVVPQKTVPPNRGGRGGRGNFIGRGRGRAASYYPAHNASWGRGRGFPEDSWGAGRGRGGFEGRATVGPGHFAIDNRTRSLVVYQSPEGFDASAQEHFSRFGEVESIATSDGSLTVQFKERKDAESAKAKGAFYNSGVLLIDWHDGEQI